MSESTSIELPKRKHNPDDGEMDITPMIDITFLLLAFFVIASKMNPQPALDLPPSHFGNALPEKNCVILIVRATDSSPGFQVLKGRSASPSTAIPPGDPEEIETAIGDYVESELSADPSKVNILIKGEGDVTTGTIMMVKRGIARSKLSKDRKIYVGTEEEK